MRKTIVLFGMMGVLAMTAVALPAQTTNGSASKPTFNTLYTFDFTDGASPVAGLVQAANGNLYGTTQAGGGSVAYGTVFKISLSGTLTTLHIFDYADGEAPEAALIQGTNGNFYGTTAFGGASGACPFGCGTVFKITPSGTLTMLHSFEDTDGALPLAALIQDTHGNLYGTTDSGGDNLHYGTVFKLTPSGTLKTLYNFCSQGDCTDGANPQAAMVQATDGSFYGTTVAGGTFVGPCGNIGCGTVFTIAPSGRQTTLHSFDATDGSGPNELVQAADGYFYGTTLVGGVNDYGTFFKTTPNGTLTTLYNFCSQDNCTDGEYPSGLVLATDGDFYGTSFRGGKVGYGTVFKITPTGTLTTLHNFCSQKNCADGIEPNGVLTQDTNGTFYGVTFQGGANDIGTVFSLSVGLGPFIETQPAAGKVGATVKILGTNLTGTTSVTFNGTSATFTVKSKSEITTTVPAGATTGTVQVVAPGGTLSSNVPFRVLP